MCVCFSPERVPGTQYARYTTPGKVCFVGVATEAEGRTEEGVKTFGDIERWWESVSGSYLDVQGGETSG